MAESTEEMLRRLEAAKQKAEELKRTNQQNTDEYKNQLIIIESINEKLYKSVDYLQNHLKQLQLQKETLEILSQQTGISVDLEKKKLEILIQDYDIQVKRLEKQIESVENETERKNLQEQIVALLKAQSKEVEKLKDLGRAEEKGKMLANLLGISEANKNSLTYQLFANPKTVLDGFSKEVQNAGGLAKSLSLSILMKVQEATLAAFYAADKAYSGFAAATGATAAYNEVITATARGNTALGISFAESGKAVTDLYVNLNTFSTLNKSTQQELTVTTAKLEKLGISGGDTAKSIQSLSMMMGISEVQAAKTVEKFAAMGQAIGVSSKQMISDFVAVKDQLAVFGKSMDETFTKLAAQAKATGVAVNNLLTLANKFDTFEGAASQVAKLNAILGGPFLSAMSMIETTDPTERINMLRQAVNNAGMSFESMSYYEKKAIADAGGFKSVEEAQRILSMSAGAAAEELQNQQASQEKLNEAIQRAQPIQEKLTLIMSNFAVVMEKPVTMLSEFLTGVLKLMDALPFLSWILGGLIVAFTALKIVQSIGAMFTALKIAFLGLAPAAAPAGPALNAAADGAAAAGQKLAVATPAILEGSAALGTLALALIGVGAAVVLVGFGFKLLFDGLANLIEQGIKAPEVFLNMAAAITALGLAIYLLSNPFVFVGIAALGAALYEITTAINSMETDKVIAFKTIMEKSVEISEPATIKNFEKFTEKFDLVAQATAKIDASKTQTFANMLIATQNLSQALKLNQTVIVKIGDKKFEGMITDTINNIMGDQTISRPTGG